MENIQDIDHRTELSVYLEGIQLKVILASRKLSKEERRTWLQAAYRAIEGQFRNLDARRWTQSGSIVHQDQAWLDRLKSQERGLVLKRALKTDTPEQKLGYEIRMRRLKSGLTQ